MHTSFLCIEQAIFVIASGSDYFAGKSHLKIY